MRKRKLTFNFMLGIVGSLLIVLINPTKSNAMHIIDGYLSKDWSEFWTVLYLPFFLFGIKSIIQTLNKDLKKSILILFSFSFVFILSTLKISLFSGSSSHPTGVGLGSILLGPTPMYTIVGMVLLFQSKFLGHGGLSTLGANSFSMAVIGSTVAFLVYKLCKKINLKKRYSIFLVVILCDTAIYTMTSIQLGISSRNLNQATINSIIEFGKSFLTMQIPVSIIEGILTVIVFKFMNINEE